MKLDAAVFAGNYTVEETLTEIQAKFKRFHWRISKLAMQGNHIICCTPKIFNPFSEVEEARQSKNDSYQNICLNLKHIIRNDWHLAENAPGKKQSIARFITYQR